MPPFSPADTDAISRASTTATLVGSCEGRPAGKMKANEFLLKNGTRHHAYEVDKAPYPLSYDPEHLDIEGLHLVFAESMGHPLSYVPEINAGHIPTRCLDLGCGQGLWVLAAAKEWIQTEFVGFDLVNIQVPLKFVETSVADRIAWVHGNFLTNRLPFDDDEFDFIRLCVLSRGIPENKWLYVLEEVHRVLAPGGVVELLEADISFPTLPLWFTSALRPRVPRNDSISFLPADDRNPSRLSATSTENSPSPQPQELNLTHEHALLESLFYSAFETRFINLQPTSIVPSYFSTLFSNVTIPPARSFSMPPFLAPPVSSLSNAPRSHILGSPMFAPVDGSPKILSPIEPTPPQLPDTPFDLFDTALTKGTEGIHSFSDNLNRDSRTSPWGQLMGPSSHSSAQLSPREIDRNMSSCSCPVDTNSFMPTGPSLHPLSTHARSAEGASLIDWHQVEPQVHSMQLYMSYLDVLACREALWEELNDRLLRSPHSLMALGWNADDDLDELQDRKKFDKLFDRYRFDMRVRLSLNATLSGVGWQAPSPGPLTKAERLKHDQLHEALRKVGQDPLDHDWATPCRTGRGMWGYKAM